MYIMVLELCTLWYWSYVHYDTGVITLWYWSYYIMILELCTLWYWSFIFPCSLLLCMMISSQTFSCIFRIRKNCKSVMQVCGQSVVWSCLWILLSFYLRGLKYSFNYIWYIKFHGSESWGQERANRLPKTKHAMNYCVSFTRANVFVIWRHNHSQYLLSHVNF